MIVLVLSGEPNESPRQYDESGEAKAEDLQYDQAQGTQEGETQLPGETDRPARPLEENV